MEIQRFDPNTMRQHETSVIIGMRNCGKTTLAKDILRYKNGHKIVIDSSEKYTNAYANITKPEFIYDTYSEEILANIITLHRNTPQQNWKFSNIVLDDCIFNTQPRPKLHYCLNNNWLHKLSLTICIQYAMSLTQKYRVNNDCVFIFNNTIVQNRRRLYEHYVGNIATFDDFCLALDSLQQFECLVIRKKQLFRYCAVIQANYIVIQAKVDRIQIIKNPEFTSQLRIIGRTRFIKNELLARVLK